MTTLHVTNEQLLREVVDLGQHPSAQAAVDAALHEYWRALKRKQLMDLAGQIDYLPDYDPIAERKRQTSAFNKQLDEWDK